MAKTPLKKTHFITLLVKNPSVVLTEHLRYMGAIRLFSTNHPTYLEPEVKSCFKVREDEALVTVQCPEGPSVNNVGLAYEWGRMQLERLSSFDVPAVWWWRDNYGLVTAEAARQTPAVAALFVDRLAEELC